MPDVLQKNEILAMWEDGRRTNYWLSQAEECPACHTMHYFFVSVNGRTTCVGCAPDSEGVGNP